MSSSNSPCAACKFLRRKCTQECVFAPYFPPDQPQKFAKVHKVFGASNVAKLLNELGANLREDAVNSLAYEADMWLLDPVYGCVGLISILQHKLKLVQNDLYNAKKELSTYIGPQAMMPILQSQAFMPQQHMGNPLSSSTAVQAQHGMFMMMGIGAGSSHSGQMVIRDQPQHQHHHQQQIFEAQQLAAAVAAREQQEMLRNFEQQQHQQQDLLRYNSGGYNGSVTTTGFNQMSGNAMLPSLALGTFDNSPYQIQAPQSVVPEHQQQQQHLAHSLQSQLLLQSQQAQPQQQQQQEAATPQAAAQQQQQQNSGSDEGRSVGPSC